MAKSLLWLDPYLNNLVNSLQRLDALVTVANHAEITALKPETAFHYMEVLIDVLAQAKHSCEEIARVRVT